MPYRRGLLVAILVYVTLDLSLPAMPGAFVFDPDDSVDSIRLDRGRGTAEVGSLLASQPAVFVVSPLGLDRQGSVDTRSANDRAPLGHRVLNQLPRAVLDSPPSSEDPH
jgi:hypothetical protein